MLKAIEGFPGYFISDEGMVFSDITNKFLKLNTNRNQYVSVCLKKNGKNHQFLIHRLVANAYLPNPENLPQVNHKDENKMNNHVSNLEWCSAKYNSNYGGGIQRHKSTFEKNGKVIRFSDEYYKKLKKPVIQMTVDGEFVAEYSSLKEAHEITGINNICLCAKGKIKQAGNYIWKYKCLEGNQ